MIIFFLYSTYTSFSLFFSSLGKIKSLGKINKHEQNMIKTINLELRKRKLITKDLTLKEINSYIDFGASNGIDYRKTNNLFKVHKVLTTNYMLNLSFAYDFFLWRWFINSYEYIFSRVFKKDGGTYFIIYKLK